MFDGLIKFWWNLCYGITKAFAWVLGLLYDLFEKAVGLDTVTYKDKQTTLLEIVFNNSAINRAFWTMAIIGIGLCFFFTILAVIKKMFDSSEQMKTSLGQILTQALKSIIIICSMSLVMSMAMYFTSSLMQGVQIAFFSNTEQPTESNPKTYSKKEYATMARIMNTIGNYALNPSYDSRYNINSCYNAIRSDLSSLKSAGTFSVQYETPDILNSKEHYWQEALEKIVVASPSLDEDVTMDKYNETLSAAIKNVMDELKNDKQFSPIEKYATSLVTTNSSNIELDRLILLVGTLDAAYDSSYNGENASITDLLRAPFYYNNKNHDVYDVDDMWDSFDMSDYHYVYMLFMIIVMIMNMAPILMSAIARIFNMAVLYIVSPPFIAMQPLDGGAKFKQWRTSFIIQCFSVFGSIVAIDLVITFIPIIMSDELVIFDNALGNFIAKLVIIWGALTTAKKAANLVNGILGENAGWSSADSLRNEEGAAGVVGAARKLANMPGSLAVKPLAKMAWNGTVSNIQDRIKEHMPFAKKESGGSEKSQAGGNESSEKSSGQQNNPATPPAKTGSGGKDKLPADNKKGSSTTSDKGKGQQNNLEFPSQNNDGDETELKNENNQDAPKDSKNGDQGNDNNNNNNDPIKNENNQGKESNNESNNNNKNSKENKSKKGNKGTSAVKTGGDTNKKTEGKGSKTPPMRMNMNKK